MPKELLFIRHGKAEDRSSTKDDTKRQLTKKGKEEFNDFVSSVKEELTTENTIHVWTSPLKRAKQTASIVCDQLDWPKADNKEYIAAGDFKTLMDEVANLDLDTRVVLVGHKPTLGQWVEKLTGTEYSFKKGGMALVTLADDDQTKGTLTWNSDPKSKKKKEMTKLKS